MPQPFQEEDADGTAPGARLHPATKDPSRRYVWAATGYTLHPCSVEDYQYRGYEIEYHREDGPKFLLGDPKKAKVGEPITIPGHGLVLMSIERDKFETQDRDGFGQHGGQRMVDEIDREIRQGANLPRSTNPDVWKVRSGFSELTPEKVADNG